MNPEESKKEKAQRFISGSSKSRFGFGTRKSIQTRIPGIIPRRSIPTAVITSNPKSSEITSGAELSDSETTFGRLLLNFVQINNDLDTIAEKIQDDFKNTKEKNKQESDEYRKRIANRGRKLTKREIKDDKKGLVETVKPFVSNFFSGAGGAIRSLALWKMMMGLLDGDVSAIFKGLFGIGLSFLPKIGMMIAGSILKNMAASMLGRTAGAGLSRGLGRGAGGGRAPRVGSPKMGIGKWAGIASLGAGALALGSAFSSDSKEESSTGTGGSETQKRLEELTAQQKDQRDIGSIAQEDLKKFESLNKKFEMAIDLLLMKPQRPDTQNAASSSSSSGSSGSTGGDLGGMSLLEGDAAPEMKSLMDTIASPESGGNYEAMYPSTTLPGATGMTISEVSRRATGPVGRYQHKPQYLEQRARDVGLDPSTALFNPQNQDLITRGHITSVLGGNESKVVERLKRNPTEVKRTLEATTYTGLQKYSDPDFESKFKSRVNQYTPSSSPSPTVQPSPRNDGRRASALVGSESSRVAFNIVPFSTSGNKNPGSVAGSGSEVPNIDPSNSRNAYAFLTQGELNLIG
jgi:hypothetical protein